MNYVPAAIQASSYNPPSQGEPEARETIRCVACNLFQYRTRNGNCRKCSQQLPSPFTPTLLLLAQATPNQGKNQEPSEARIKDSNLKCVESIGKRVWLLRYMKGGLSQAEFEAISGVSRSYLCRIELGKMQPSLGTLEKMANALKIPLGAFFVSEEELCTYDPFVVAFQIGLRELEKVKPKIADVIRKMLRDGESLQAITEMARKFR